MTTARTVMSAVSILLGVAIFAGWHVAHVVVGVVESGTTAREMTARALDSRSLVDAIGSDIAGVAGASLDDQGVDVAKLERDGHLAEVMTHIAGSPEFRVAILTQAQAAHAQVNDQLTDPSRPSAPLIISVDVSEVVRGGVGDLGGPAAALRSVELSPIDIRIVEADQFERVRDGYAAVRWAHTWGLWLSLGVLGVGYAISYRKRWFPAKVLCGIAGMSFGVAGAATLVGPEVFVRFLPGGEDSVGARLLLDVVGPQAFAIVIEKSVLVGGLALVGGLIAVAIGAVARKRRREGLNFREL